MEQSRRRLEDRLSELADHRKTTGTAILETTAKTPSWLIGSKPKESQVAPRRKESYMTLPVSRNWKAWNSMGLHHRLEDRLSELADYRKINGHCNVPTTTAKRSWLIGSPKGSHYRLHHEGKKSL
jgi:hypothetical protein